MNILVADSGSSKTDWILFHGNGNKTYFSTNGLNPYFQDEVALVHEINELSEHLKNIRIDALYFYGAGVRNDSQKLVLKSVLSKSFKFDKIIIDTDLKGAAIACFGKEKGIVCILGTGSNAGLFDGVEIIKTSPSLGFVLGDEGSGSYFGKQLLNDYYYQKMPKEIQKVLREEYDLTLQNILDRVYKESKPNQFISSLLKGLQVYKDHPYVEKLFKKGFEVFVDKQLAYFKESKTLPVGFAGSIAFNYQSILREVLDERSINLHKIIQQPIEELAEFYSRV